MDPRYEEVTAVAATQHGGISTEQLAAIGVGASLRHGWVTRGLLARVGPRSYVIAGSPPTWRRDAWAAMADTVGVGFVAGRTAARLHGLDGFDGFDGFDGDSAEVLVQRRSRGVCTPHRIASTSFELHRSDSIVIAGIRCLTAERTILDAPLFGFTRAEVENAIDSAIRLKLVSEQRLRTRVVDRHRSGINNSRTLLDALVDAGGESRLERWFLALVRRAGLQPPLLQVTMRDGSRTVARVDAFFAGGLVVELAGHGTHSSRRARQIDEQRRTELVLRGLRVITFTYDDIRDRPDWVIARLRQALIRIAA